MEGEINNFIFVWATVLSSLCYCFKVGKIFPQGNLRRLAILPVACLFIYLPLNLTTIHLGGTTSFFIAWLASFKLILFAFNKGPLSSLKIPLSRFIPLACLPIKAQQQESTKKNQKSALNYVIKIVLLALCVRVYAFKDSLPQKFLWFFYCLHIYFMLEILLAAVAAIVRGLMQVELEPQFDEPYLATSLQDFWGRRWNLMVSNILRPTVYEPVRSISTRLIGRKSAPLPAVVATFLVSGLMHELVFYNIGRLKPTGEVMCFFILNGVALATEIAVKRVLKGKFWLPGILSVPLTLAFVALQSCLPGHALKEAGASPATEPVEDKNTHPASAPASKAQVVGWPPIRSFRKSALATNLSKNCDPEAKSGPSCLYVKVSMDGAPYLRKLDLKTYFNYAELSSALEKMFSCFTIGQCTSDGLSEQEGLKERGLKDLLHDSKYVLTYEDKDGDWMLVGDVPWEMFTSSCKRLRIMRGSDIIGLAPRAMQKFKNQN